MTCKGIGGGGDGARMRGRVWVGDDRPATVPNKRSAKKEEKCRM